MALLFLVWGGIVGGWRVGSWRRRRRGIAASEWTSSTFSPESFVLQWWTQIDQLVN